MFSSTKSKNRTTYTEQEKLIHNFSFIVDQNKLYRAFSKWKKQCLCIEKILKLQRMIHERQNLNLNKDFFIL